MTIRPQGRPRVATATSMTGETPKLTVRLAPEDRQQLARAAKLLGENEATIMRRALAFYFARAPELKPIRD